MLTFFIRGIAFGIGMMIVSLIGSWLWTGYLVTQWYDRTRHLVPDNSREGVRARLQQEVAAYNAELANLSTPEVTALGRTLSGETLTTRFMMNRFVAPGERQQIAARLRDRTAREACNRYVPALRVGFRLVYSYADIVGGEMRFVYAAQDCSGV